MFLRCRRKDASNRSFCDSIRAMGDGLESLPDDIETLKAALIVARAEAAAARARQSDDQALIAHAKKACLSDPLIVSVFWP